MQFLSDCTNQILAITPTILKQNAGAIAKRVFKELIRTPVDLKDRITTRTKISNVIVIANLVGRILIIQTNVLLGEGTIKKVFDASPFSSV